MPFLPALSLTQTKPPLWASLRFRLSRFCRRPIGALRMWWQRRTRGFDDSELWSLDHTIARFTLPRFKAFRKDEQKLMARTEEPEWERGQDEIEWMLEKMAADDWPSNLELSEQERFEKASRLFGERLGSFWT
jgi:hypothetical protein